MELEARNERSESFIDSDSIKQTENFIDAMFIERTVKKCFEGLSSNFLDKMKGYVDEAVRIKKLSSDDELLFGDSDTRLISKMNSEISFLRDEIKNKNRIIEVLLLDRNHTHPAYTQSSSKQTDKSVKFFENCFESPKIYGFS